MPAFAHTFAGIVTEFGGQAEISRASGVPQPTISRLVKSRNPPDLETLGKLLSALPDPLAGQLLTSYIEDITPESGRHLLRIEPRHSTVEETAPAYGKKLKLRPSLRKALDRLAQLCHDDMEFADFVEGMVKQFDR